VGGGKKRTATPGKMFLQGRKVWPEKNFGREKKVTWKAKKVKGPEVDFLMRKRDL